MEDKGMGKISKIILSILLFIVDTYGERIFNFVYTILLRAPREMFTMFCVIISSILLIIFINL